VISGAKQARPNLELNKITRSGSVQRFLPYCPVSSRVQTR
jgi:hypothetical protein